MTCRVILRAALAAPAAVALAMSLAIPAAADCPPATLDTEAETRLIESLRAAPDAAAARKYNARLWEMWTDAPDPQAQNLLDSGMARIRLGDLKNAIKAFDALVAYCPEFAEGYNQRAFARYLRQEFEPALADLDAALALSPRHVGALSGKALVLMGLGRDRAALETLEVALDLNPHLSERALVAVLEERLGATDL